MPIQFGHLSRHLSPHEVNVLFLKQFNHVLLPFMKSILLWGNSHRPHGYHDRQLLGLKTRKTFLPNKNWLLLWYFCIKFETGISNLLICGISHHVKIRSNETVIWSVYEVKWVLFKLFFCHLKLLACPWPLQCSIPRVRAFKWGNVWHSISRGIRTARCLS